MIYRDLECIFVHIPKTGGTSIETALARIDRAGAGHRHDHRSLRAIEAATGLVPMLAGSLTSPGHLREAVRIARTRRGDSLTRAEFRRFTKATFVRNPFDRAVSWYRNVMRDPQHQRRQNCDPDTPFPEFLKRFAGRGMLKPQTFWIKDSRGRLDIDFVGRFETIAEDFETLVKRHLRRSGTLPHLLDGATGDYRRYYDDAAIDRVRRIYAEEIDLFGYDFDS